MSDGTELPPGEEKNLEEHGAVTVCDLEIQEKNNNAFNDEHFYCDICHKHFLDECDVHGSPLFTTDTTTPMGAPQRALLTLPHGLVIGRSLTPEAGLGVFNQGQVIPLGMHFGPFDGELSSQEKAMESAHSWVVCRGQEQNTFIDAERDTHSNWMRYVVCSLNESDQNLVAIQQNGRVLFRSCRPIYPGQELRVWYGEEYAQSLGTIWDKIWDKKCSSLGRSKEHASQVCLCPYCQYSFPTAYYLHRHVRRSHPTEYPNLVEAQNLELGEQVPITDLNQCLLVSDTPVSKSTGQAEVDGETEDSGNKCADCGRTFLRSCHLKRHQRTIHSKEKPYCCSRCRKCFSQATGLKRHQQSHHQDAAKGNAETQLAETGDALSDIFTCTECSFSFVTELNLYKHLKRYHHAQYLKLVEKDSFSPEILQAEECLDKNDAPYEPPTKQRRSTSNTGADRGQNKKQSSGRPRGRPPKIKKQKNTPKQEGGNEPDGQNSGLESAEAPAVPEGGDSESVELPQEAPASSHVCGECLRSFSQLSVLKSHECIQQGDGPHGCSHCELYFNRLCNLRRHERTIHAKERPYCCTLCLKSFTQSSGLKRHQESHSRRRAHRQSLALASATIYACAHCPFSFTAERYLHKHIRRHHPEMSTKYLSFTEGDVASKEHSCTQCSKTFQTIRGFKNHACFRQGDQLYLCPDCGKAFNWFNSLKQHQRIHTGVKPFACAQCEKSFVHSGQLNVHMRTHTGEKPFLCAECGESFRQSGDLRRHEQKHSGVRPWQCPDCGKSFSRPQSLRAHQQLHKGTKLFPCTQCGKSFARRYHLTRHHQKMHS